MNAVPASATDPMPQPPVAPDLDACCGNGCDPCIFDLHDLAMDEYRQALRAWNSRQQEAASVAARNPIQAEALPGSAP